MRALVDPGAPSRVGPLPGVAVSALVFLPANWSAQSMLPVATVLTAIVITAALLVPWVWLPS